MFLGGKPKDQSSEEEKPNSETTRAPAADVTAPAAEAAPAAAAVASGAATTASAAAPESDPEHDLGVDRRTAAARGLSTMFGEIVTLFMRTPPYKELWLTDLEWLVMPALCRGQVSLATTRSKTSGAMMTVGAVLWARVSDKVDQRLAARPEETIRLATNEWTSGDIVWIVASAGEGRVLGEMLKRLAATEWAGKDVKMIVRAIDGKPMVVSLATGSAAAA